MNKAKHRVVELAVAWNGREGDSGDWDTHMVEIPADTPDDDIEQVAIAAYERDLPPDSREDYQHAWLYWAGSADDDSDDDTDEEE